MSDSQYIRLGKVVTELGWIGDHRLLVDQLRSALRAKEEKHNVTLLFGKRGTTRKLLKRYCPEFFVKSGSELMPEVKAQLRSMRDKTEDLIHMIVSPQLQELRARDEEIAKEVVSLRKDFGSLAEAVVSYAQK